MARNGVAERAHRRGDGWALPARLEGGSLAVARVTWIAAAVGLVALVVVGFVRASEDPSLVELPALTGLLSELGWSFRFVNAVALVPPFVVVVGVCGFVFRRRSHDPMALLFMMALLVLYAYSSRALLTFADGPILRHAASIVLALTMVSLSLVLTLFPDGRFAPRKSWLLPVGTVMLAIAFPDAEQLIQAVSEGEVPARAPFFMAGFCGVVLIGTLAQGHRYRHVSGLAERQQAKWVMVPLVLWILTVLLAGVVSSILGGAAERWFGAVLLLAVIPLSIVFPLAVANAVLRYRLYQIDRVVSRTASYAVLTVILAGIYAISVVGFGGIVSSVSGGGGGDLVVAASTLAVAAAFRPVRRRVQEVVDRRFNRARYDAARTIAAFTARLRDEMDLDVLTAELRDVASQTMRPTGASMWMTARVRR